MKIIKKPRYFILILLAFFAFIATGFIMSSAQSTIKTKGVNHIGLNVQNLQLTSEFFIETLNFTKVGERPNYPAIFVSDGVVMVTLWQTNNPDSAIPFDRKNNIGLHHLALNLSNFADLDVMYQKLKNRPDIEIEFAPELMGKGPAKHMMFYEPGGIRIELTVKP
jgi:catechol-2,3-dioxygenase